MLHRTSFIAIMICSLVVLLVGGAAVASAASGSAGKAKKPPQGPPFLKAAAGYLEVTPKALLKELKKGTTLAAIAADKGKAVDGLKAAIISDAETKLAADVASGKLTQAQADDRLEHLNEHIDDIVNNPLPKRGPGGCRPPA